MKAITVQVAFCCLIFLTRTIPQTIPVEGSTDPTSSLDPTSALDLVDSPLAITVLQFGGLKFRDHFIESTFTRQLGDMAGRIEGAIAGKNKLGYLLKVNIYSDEFGTLVIPGGQLLFPIGVGTEPLDALAEFTRTPVVMHGESSGFDNRSYYVWITKKGPKYSVDAIRQESRSAFEKRAREEAHRRDLLAIYSTALPADAVQSVKRAAYWQEVVRTYADHLKSEANREEVQALSQQFVNAQRTFNAAYRAFQETEAELAKQKRDSQVLLIASTVAQMVENACHAKSLVSSTGAPVSSQAAPTVSLKDAYVQLSIKTRETALEYKRQQRIIELQESGLERRNRQLRQIFQQDGVPIPRAEEPMLLKP